MDCCQASKLLTFSKVTVIALSQWFVVVNNMAFKVGALAHLGSVKGHQWRLSKLEFKSGNIQNKNFNRALL